MAPLELPVTSPVKRSSFKSVLPGRPRCTPHRKSWGRSRKKRPGDSQAKERKEKRLIRMVGRFRPSKSGGIRVLEMLGGAPDEADLPCYDVSF